jgi:hypothetical protein
MDSETKFWMFIICIIVLAFASVYVLLGLPPIGKGIHFDAPKNITYPIPIPRN